MSKHGYVVTVQCPFYKGEDPCEIQCEGMVQKSVIHQTFKTKNEKQDFQRHTCCSRWKDCPIANYLNQKYEEEENNV